MLPNRRARTLETITWSSEAKATSLSEVRRFPHPRPAEEGDGAAKVLEGEAISSWVWAVEE
jgi:hypothetical protein